MVTEPPTSQCSQDEIPEIEAFRYTAASTQSTLNPLNLNGLAFGAKRRSLSNRMAKGIRFLVAIATPKPEQPKIEPASEDLGVLRYNVPLYEYRARRKRSTAMAKKMALAGAVIAIVPLAMTISTNWRSHQPVSLSKAPLAAAQNPGASVALPPATYIVQADDTLSSIARRHHIRLKALRAANLPNGDKIKPGQVLTIPVTAVVISTAHDPNRASGVQLPQRSSTITSASALAEHEATGLRKREPVRKKRTYYKVKEGDSLSTIAAKYDLRSSNLVEVNDLDLHTRLRIGRKILIPATPEGKAENRFRERDKQRSASRGLLGDLGRAVSRKFLWPTMGKVSSYFGYRGNHFHAGLDIPNQTGAAIHASKAGVVVGAGWEGDYGKTIDISHGNGVVTRYAHCSKLLVREGQQVARGQTIGLIGETGHATGPHLHYEVRVYGRPVDPKQFI